MILRFCDPGLDEAGSRALRAAGPLLERLTAGLGHPSWTVNLVPVDDDRMETLNGDFRRKPGVTDVLSFSYLETAGDGTPDLAAGDRSAAVDLWREAAPDEAGDAEAVGEIVLAPGFVADRCAAEGWNLDDELCLLVVHGCLHILGWDHLDDDDRAAMQAAEQDILGGAGIGHPLLKRS